MRLKDVFKSITKTRKLKNTKLFLYSFLVYVNFVLS